jgi:hypothetical protein
MATILSFINIVYNHFLKTFSPYRYTLQDINDFINSDSEMRRINEILEDPDFSHMHAGKMESFQIKKINTLKNDIHRFLSGLNLLAIKFENYIRKIKRPIYLYKLANNIPSKTIKGYKRSISKYRNYIEIQAIKYRENSVTVANRVNSLLTIDMRKVKEIYFPIESFTSPRKIIVPKSSPLKNEINIDDYLQRKNPMRSRSKSFS